MKKTIALVLCLLMVVSLAACGGQATADESSASAEQTETAEPTTEETTQQEESSEPVETEPVETEPAFDTSWASNDFEKLIPQPPFEGWSGEKTSDNIYKMETSQANADGSGTYYDTWAAYIQTLNDCGFVVKGDTYNSEGTDSNGNKVELQCGDGHAWITIIKAASISAADDSSLPEIPALPEGDWEREQFNDITYIMTIDEIDYADIEKYIETLSSENFTIIEIESDSGTYCEYQAEKNVGDSSLRINIQYGTDGTNCRVAVMKK